MKANKTSLSMALTAALGTSGVALAADSNPFAMQSLEQGYMLAQSDKAGEGKCGGKASEKAGEGKCGGKAEAKAAEGKCGGKAEKKEKDAEGKCGEGKCGGNR